jgi:hypothetical protein
MPPSKSGIKHLLVRIHPHQDLGGGNKIAFINKNVLYAAGRRGGDIDVGCFDASIRADKPRRERFRLQPVPCEVADSADRNGNPQA